MKALVCILAAVSISESQAEPSFEIPPGTPKTPMKLEMDKAEDSFFDAVDAAKVSYRKSLAETLMIATKVEVFQLEPYFTCRVKDAYKDSAWSTSLPHDQFPVIPTFHYATILDSKELTPIECRVFLPILKETISAVDSGGGVLCHFPAHGIRVWDGDRIAFQTTISYECMEFYIDYPGVGADFVGLPNVDLFEVLKALIPIPPEQQPARNKNGEQD